MDCFQIEWTGPYSSEVAPSKPEAKKKGVYAFFEMDYGDPKTLLYVGKAKDLGRRISQHNQAVVVRFQSESEKKKTAVFFGVVKPLEGKLLSDEQLDDIESLLIYSLKPAGNKSKKSRNTAKKSLLILNTGETGRRMDRVVTDRTDILELVKKGLSSMSSW